MKTKLTFDTILSDAHIPEILEQVVRASDNFSELVNLMKLDKYRDFRYSDLGDVDFSNSDLRGFDFTGADLRNSSGINVLFDDSTILTDADLEGSCFAVHKREAELFGQDRSAKSVYQRLLTSDPYEFSQFIHNEFRNGDTSVALVKDVDLAILPTLLQKLLMDSEVSLTKQVDVFFRVTEIVPDPTTLREIMLNVLATDYENKSFILAFTRVALRLYREDRGVMSVILDLTNAEDSEIREAAFRAINTTNFALEHLDTLRQRLLNDDNIAMQKKLIRQTSREKGRLHIAAINRDGSRDFEELDDNGTFGYHELLQTINADENSVTHFQEDVLISTPILRMFFVQDNPARANAALSRIEKQKRQEQDRSIR